MGRGEASGGRKIYYLLGRRESSELGGVMKRVIGKQKGGNNWGDEKTNKSYHKR